MTQPLAPGGNLRADDVRYVGKRLILTTENFFFMQLTIRNLKYSVLGVQNSNKLIFDIFTQEGYDRPP